MTHTVSGGVPDRHLTLAPAPAGTGTGFPDCLLPRAPLIPVCDDCQNWAPLGPGRWQCTGCGRVSDRSEPDPRQAAIGLTDLQRHQVEKARDALDTAAGVEIGELSAPMLTYQVALIEGHALNLLQVIDALTADLR